MSLARPLTFSMLPSEISGPGATQALFDAQPHALLLGRSIEQNDVGTPANVAVPALLGFAGFGQSGKDSVASVLQSRYGHRIASTGQAVAALLCDINPLVAYAPGRVAQFAEVLERYGYEGAKEFVPVRTLMQDAGEQIKSRAPRYWIDLLLEQAVAAPTAIVGVRSIDEVAAIRAQGGMTIWVSRPGFGPMGGHENEKRLTPQDCDATLVNDGTLADLEVTLSAVLLNR